MAESDECLSVIKGVLPDEIRSVLKALNQGNADEAEAAFSTSSTGR